MLRNSFVKVFAIQKHSLLLPVQVMAFHPSYLPKYRDISRPTWHENVTRRWDSASHAKRRNLKPQDPLYLNHEYEQVNGGINLLLEYLHEKNQFAMPNKNKAHILYNMV